ncbi:prolyl oligopeptidase family serine peptidase [Kitasatospora sp. NPDC002227]|uniref:alpha/beta hydrolase family protein n=1 Tax=Kitasatospora sp. NPDC002227 TaxID=3154773 RepID=UPI00331EA9A0
MSAAALFAERERDLLCWSGGPVRLEAGESGLRLVPPGGGPPREIAPDADLAALGSDGQRVVSARLLPDGLEITETDLAGGAETWRAELPDGVPAGRYLADITLGVTADGAPDLVLTLEGEDTDRLLLALARDTPAYRLDLPPHGRLLLHDRGSATAVLEEQRGPDTPLLRLYRTDGTPYGTLEGTWRDVRGSQALVDVGDAVEVRDVRDCSLTRRIETDGEVRDARFLGSEGRVAVLTCVDGADRLELTDPGTTVGLGGAIRVCAAGPAGIGLHAVSTLGASVWAWLSPDGTLRTAPGTVPAFRGEARTEQLRRGRTPIVLHRTGAAPKGLLIAVHGGPESLERDELRWEGVYRDLLAAGVAVAGVNYGGSLGFGRAHRERPWHDWRRSLEEDFAACLDLGRELGVDRAATALLGGSFGASAALLAAGAFPGLAGVVACSPMVDLGTFRHRVEQQEPRYAPWFDRRFGAADHRYFSPASLLGTGATPVVVVQGDADEVVDAAEAGQLAAAARAAGLDWRLVLEQGAAHQPSSPAESSARHALLLREIRALLP